VHFYHDLRGNAVRDSWIVERLRGAGAVITGKTHLHPLAYGITGENPEFGDCVQPRDPTALTGGSSSGAAASVQEGSAVVAIGTDTGGSIRAPAALCGLAGYRASLGRGDWSGGAHLAQSFDTMGCLFRDLADAPLLAGLFADKPAADPSKGLARFAVVDESFFHDCEKEIIDSLHSTIREFEALGLESSRIDVAWWADSFEIFAPSTRGILTGLSLRFESGLSGARELAIGKSLLCEKGTGFFVSGWTRCWPRTSLYCFRPRLLRAWPRAPTTARRASGCCATQRHSAWRACRW
jgi:aspartyl-tRNA(Asn)/glutamyl-tRNA(Gln) amidotransferase subunit A